MLRERHGDHDDHDYQNYRNRRSHQDTTAKRLLPRTNGMQQHGHNAFPKYWRDSGARPKCARFRGGPCVGMYNAVQWTLEKLGSADLRHSGVCAPCAYLNPVSLLLNVKKTSQYVLRCLQNKPKDPISAGLKALADPTLL